MLAIIVSYVCGNYELYNLTNKRLERIHLRSKVHIIFLSICCLFLVGCNSSTLTVKKSSVVSSQFKQNASKAAAIISTRYDRSEPITDDERKEIANKLIFSPQTSAELDLQTAIYQMEQDEIQAGSKYIADDVRTKYLSSYSKVVDLLGGMDAMREAKSLYGVHDGANDTTQYSTYDRADEPMVGMDETNLIRVWGNPQRKNSTTTSSGTSEQWVYGNGRYVYLSSGIVTAIQDSN